MASVEGARSFTAGGDAYDAFMGRYAVLLAPLMADLAGVRAGQRALDVGCGTGALTGELVRRLGADHVTGCDPAPGQLAACRAKHPDVELHEAPAEELPFEDDAFDVALAQLVLHFATDAERAVEQMRRVVVPGGRVAACVWDFEGGMEMLRAFWDAAVTVDPRAPDELLTMRFGRGGELTSLLEGAGLVDVAEERLEVRTRYTDVQELWSTLLLGVGPAGTHLVALPPEQREALRTAYLDRLGHPTGPFTLGSVARAAVGTVPHTA
ncbi:class I SAM-dependent methyltransferase [Ornithinimicrobium pekingense]|uniref:Methyltransferase n=1 Tax=Ornithinimicrobium pekingense TaxID=384677 RepID=A0ABQ2F7D7_9MICO|nr:class I SAM-dependent methyltransferase [Ornithinimicrobium pekingense]GGK67990.1 methyltransferase [Ornithinimicrobium pekingense]